MTKKGLLSRMCLAVPVSLLLASVATAQTEITVTEQTQAAIQTALNRLGGPGTVILPPGRYQVFWSVVARDGHRTEGSFPFRVK